MTVKKLSRPVRLLTVMLVMIISLTSCYVSGSSGGGHISLGGGPGTPSGNPPSGSGNVSFEGEEGRLTADEHKIAVFLGSSIEGFWARNDRGNGHPFNCSFSNKNAVISDDRLTISLTESGGKYIGAEYRSAERFSYGYFSTRMKAAKGDGIISSFFTYTGHPWDEIDIEFLGDDTTRVQFNYFTRGVGHHEYVYDLGFDASEDFHEYGFDWQPDSITWYVDGRAVYRATKNIPTTAGQLMVNIWNVADSNADWAGKFDPKNLPATAEYLWFGYQSAE